MLSPALPGVQVAVDHRGDGLDRVNPVGHARVVLRQHDDAVAAATAGEAADAVHTPAMCEQGQLAVLHVDGETARCAGWDAPALRRDDLAHQAQRVIA